MSIFHWKISAVVSGVWKIPAVVSRVQKIAVVVCLLDVENPCCSIYGVVSMV